MIPATRTTAALTQATTLGWSSSVCISPNSDPTIRAARAMAAAMLPITQLCQRLCADGTDRGPSGHHASSGLSGRGL